jgi:hypothetical protein
MRGIQVPRNHQYVPTAPAVTCGKHPSYGLCGSVLAMANWKHLYDRLEELAELIERVLSASAITSPGDTTAIREAMLAVTKKYPLMRELFQNPITQFDRSCVPSTRVPDMLAQWECGTVATMNATVEAFCTYLENAGGSGVVQSVANDKKKRAISACMTCFTEVTALAHKINSSMVETRCLAPVIGRALGPI